MKKLKESEGDNELEYQTGFQVEHSIESIEELIESLKYNMYDWKKSKGIHYRKDDDDDEEDER